MNIWINELNLSSNFIILENKNKEKIRLVPELSANPPKIIEKSLTVYISDIWLRFCIGGSVIAPNGRNKIRENNESVEGQVLETLLRKEE